MLSCQQTQNVIDGKKRIILNPAEGQKKDFETVTFAEGEVYGVDILVSSGEDGKVKTYFSCSSVGSLTGNCLRWRRRGWRSRERRSTSATIRFRTSSR